MKACHIITPKAKPHLPLKTYACWTKNNADRSNSSSGGAFPVLARRVLSMGGVVYGATMTSDLVVRHIAVIKQEDLILLQGSKYVQSQIEGIYKDVRTRLSSGEIVLFSGTPCQVAGLKAFLKRDYENLLTCDVVCHGVPSQAAFDVYIDKIGIRDKSESVNFRFTEGWGFRLSRQTVAPTRGRGFRKKAVSPVKAYYMRAFTKGLMFGEACYNCRYAHPERISDFTLADFWGLGDRIPFNYPTNKGISCMLVNSQRGLDFINSCEELERVERPLEEAIEGNHNLSHVSGRPKGRDTYFDDSITMNVRDLSAKYNITATLRDYLRILKQYLFILKIRHVEEKGIRNH